MHPPGVLIGNPLSVCHELIYVMLRLWDLGDRRVELEALPLDLYFFFVGELGKGGFKVPFADVAKGAHNITPNLDFHFLFVLLFFIVQFSKIVVGYA
jgi:hypothetical protein